MMRQWIKRESLVTQVVGVLKQEWPQFIGRKWLPGERVLSHRFQVSRNTIRAALAQLRRQKLIRAYPQRGYRILTPLHRHKEQASRVIGCMWESTSKTSELQSQLMIRDIEHGLETGGYELKIHTDVYLRGGSHRQRLENLIGTQRAACWMLKSSSFETQQWFVNRAIPALVQGSCYPGIPLPNVDVDYLAVCRHAAVMLWRLGHRQICMLAPQSRFGGDVYSEQGFQSALLQLSRGTHLPKILYHNGNVENIQRILDGCLSKTPSPTAFLVSGSTHALTVLTYLMSHGIRVPQEMSLVCRNDNEFLEHVIPSMARYTFDRRAYARRCVRALIQLATSGHLKPGSRWMMARLFRGDTVASPAGALTSGSVLRR